MTDPVLIARLPDGSLTLYLMDSFSPGLQGSES